MDEYNQVLVELGLTSLQAKTLLAMNAQNYKTARNISKTASVARQQIYRILPDLQKLGLIEEKISVPNQYRALPIKVVLNILVGRKNKQTNETLEKASKLIKATNEVNQPAQQETEDYELKIVTGLENIEKTFRSAYESSDKISYIGTLKPWAIQASNRLNFSSFKLKKGVDYREIFGPPPESSLYSPRNRKVRTVPFEVPMFVGLFDDKKALLSIYPKKNSFEPEDFTVLSCNFSCIVELLKVYFEIVWNFAQEYKPNENRLTRKRRREKSQNKKRVLTRQAAI